MMPRCWRPRCAAGALLRVGMAFFMLPVGEVSMAQECPLTAPLTVKDLQGGVVGQTGTVRTVALDCSFTVARQVAINVAEPHRTGQLTSDQQVRLRQLLTRTDPATLPKTIGEPRVNGRQILLTYGRVESSLSLAPGGGNLAALRGAASDPVAARILELAEALQEMTGS